MSKKLLFLNNLKSERLLTEFTINKTFDNSYNIQNQPSPINFQLYECYINLLEVYDCNIKS